MGWKQTVGVGGYISDRDQDSDDQASSGLYQVTLSLDRAPLHLQIANATTQIKCIIPGTVVYIRALMYMGRINKQHRTLCTNEFVREFW